MTRITAPPSPPPSPPASPPPHHLSPPRRSPPRPPLVASPSPSSSASKAARARPKRPHSLAEWAPLAGHVAFSGRRAASSDAGNGWLAAWDPVSSRLYAWDPTSRGAHRIAVRLRDGGGEEEEEEVAVEGAVPSELLMPESQISYEVSHISLNKEGSSLLLAGCHGINIIYVHERISGDGDTVVCRTVSVASQILPSQNDGLKVLQASWHPFSSSHLGVLTSDAVFRLFDLSTDLERPEQEFYLQPVLPGRCQNALSICPVAFSYGSDHLWDRFSVLFLFSDGLCYVLCPIVPFGSDCGRRHIQEIFEDINAFGLKSSNPNVVSNSHLAIAWLEATFPNVQHQSTESSMLLVSRAHPYAPIDASLTLQGPLCGVGHGEDTNDSDGKNSPCEGRAVGFLYSSVGKDSVLVTAWSSGQLQIDALADEIQPHWNVGISPRLKVDPHGHIKSVAMICDSNLQDLLASKSHLPFSTGSNASNNTEAAWLGHSPPLLRLAIVDLALPKASTCGLSLFLDPLIPERFYCVHGGGIDMVALHYLPFSYPEMTMRPPSVHPILTTGNNDVSSPFLSGFVTIADAYGHVQLVGITFSFECIVLEMKGWKEPVPFQFDLDSKSAIDVESSIPEMISKEILAGPNVAILPSSTSLRSLTSDSVEGRSALHHYIKLFHENYVEYAHKVFIELKEHGDYLKTVIQDQQKRLQAVKQSLLSIESKDRGINDRTERAFKVYDLLEKRLESFKRLPAGNKKPLSRAEQEFKAQLGRFAEIELDALRSSIDALNTRMKRYARSSSMGGATDSPWQTPRGGRSLVSDAQMSLLKSSLEKLSLINEENTLKLRLIEHELKSQEE